MDREKLVVVGGGMASARFVERLSADAPGRYSITMIGEEPRLAYNRVLLSSVLAGELSIDDIDLKPARFWKESGVEFLAGQKVTRIDRGRRRLSLQGGREIPYSKLVIATGSRAIRLPIDGAGLRGVHTFRDIHDVAALTRLGMSKRHVLVIGGGLLGLEAAYGLAQLGMQVTLAHVLDRLMERQLDAPGADILRRAVEQKAIRVLLNANAVAIRGEGHVQRVDFDDGRSIDVDAVVFAVGVRPNAELAQEAGLTVNRGVVVDDGLTTGDPNIFAIGECAEHRGLCYGLVEPAYEQGRVLAMRLAGEEATYDGSVVSTNLKVSGVRVFSAGDFMGDAHTRQILYRDPAMGVYRKLVLQDDKLKGAILIGNTTGALDLLELIRSGATIAANTDDLMFGAPIARAA
jgi:nitrite reductase (NADH) large subunit